MSAFYNETRNRRRNFTYRGAKLENTLGTLISMKDFMISNQSDHKETFKLWREKRIESIDQLNEVIKDLEMYEETCNSVKLAAETVGAISDAVSVIGAFLHAIKVTDMDTSKSMIKSGRAGSQLGNIVSEGIMGFKGCIEAYKVRKAKNILREDAELTNKLTEYFKPSQEFVGLLNEVIEFDVFLCIVEGFKKAKTNSRSIETKKRRKNKWRQITLPSDVETTIDYLPISDLQKKDARQFMVTLFQTYDGWNMFQELADLDKNYPFAFEALKAVSNLHPDYFHRGRHPLPALRHIEESPHFMKISTTKDVFGQGLLSATRLADNILRMSETAERISNQEPSEFAKKLKDASFIMQQELNNFDEVYHELGPRQLY